MIPLPLRGGRIVIPLPLGRGRIVIPLPLRGGRNVIPLQGDRGRVVLALPGAGGHLLPGPPANARGDLVTLLGSAAALMAWDASGWDLAVARWVGGAAGFAWRDAWWTSRLLHDGGRWTAWALLLALMVAAWLTPAAPAHGPTRVERWRWLGVMLAAAVAVPALKRFSTTSCPWDLAEFGGAAAHVSHWHIGLADGGPGHCFPSGHAVAAFAFVGLYFMWRDHDRRRARAWLLVVALAGLAFGGAQLLRGAHFPSHTLWSAWLCWTMHVAAARWLRRPPRPT